jgi:hypothetical protein
MIEVLRTNDLVRLDYALQILKAEGCPVVTADHFISAVEGGIGAFGRRILVPDEWAESAREALRGLDVSPQEPGT